MSSVLVLGGARSGKSRYAENRLPDSADVHYVATGPVPDGTDPEWSARVATHRQQRPASWRTVETADPAAVLRSTPGSILLDCLGTWLTRLFDEAGVWEDPARADAVRAQAAEALVGALRTRREHADLAAGEVVIVSNETGWGVVPATVSGRMFRDQLGRLNTQVATACDQVILVVAGRAIDLPAVDLNPADTASVATPAPAPAPTPGAAREASSPAAPGEHLGRDAWRLAFGTLTAWRVPPPTTINTRVAGRAMLLAPLVMAPLALLLILAAWAAVTWHAPPLLVGAVLVGAVVLSTRGMHLDGLADTCDGLSAAYDRRRALAVMRTGDVGPSGAGAITLVLLIQTAAVADLVADARAGEPGGPLLVAACMALLASRHVLAWGCRRGVPAARPQGLGVTMAGSVGRWPLAGVTGTLAALGALTAWATGGAWWVPVVVIAVAVAAALTLLARAVHRLGGITGDVLGASIEIALTAGLSAAAVCT